MVVSRPETRIAPVVDVLHGVEVRDPYRWLENGDDLEVRAWVSAQNAYTRSVLDGLPERAAIEARIRQALDVGALGGTEPRGGRRLFTRRDPGMDQPVLMVTEGDGPPRTLVDPAPLSVDGTTALDWWVPSPDGE